MKAKQKFLIPLMVLFLIGISPVLGANAGTIKGVDIDQDSATSVDFEVEINVNFTGTIYIECKVYDGSSKIGEEEDSFSVTTADVDTKKTVSVTIDNDGLSNGDTLKVKTYLKDGDKVQLDTDTETFAYAKSTSTFWTTNNMLMIIIIAIAVAGGALVLAYLGVLGGKAKIPK